MEPIASQIETIAAVARRHGVTAYLVGGYVRDRLLARKTRDLDLVVEGDAIELAARLAEEFGGTLRAHRAFLTAVVDAPGGVHLDVATARSEVYRAPAALPEVRPSDLRQDLFRRDFTVNTLALRLGSGDELIDLFDGRRDLEAKTLRVLHERSFVDDPTRILRAVRLGLRLGFDIAPDTLDLARAAIDEKVFDHLSGSRLRDELALLLDDPALALRGIERLEEIGVLRAIDSRLELDAAAFERLQAVHAAYEEWGNAAGPVALWRLFLMALAAGLGANDRERLADRLLLAGEDRRLLTGFAERLEDAGAILRSGPRPHRAAEVLEPLAGEELLLLPDEHNWVRRYLDELRPITLELRGADLLAAGVPPGPRIGEALRATKRARLDGLVDPGGELR
jgi:tRNA nucleotidyltransferase (CCA-adding enzyme)